MRRLGASAIVCGLLAVIMGLVSLAEFVRARPFALGFAVIAGVFGMAAVVTRQVHAALAGRVDLLSQALEASQNAHLVLARDGGIAYANAAFRRFFPELGSPPLDALGKRFAADDTTAVEFARLRHEAAQYGRACRSTIHCSSFSAPARPALRRASGGPCPISTTSPAVHRHSRAT